MPKATIVVPAYNVAATLPQTLASLEAQSFRDMEIVIVDDGSTDNTRTLAEKYADGSRIRLVTQTNRGLAGARNSGIAAARGDYIGFCDADDLWHPLKLAAHVAHLDANRRIGVSYSGSVLIDAHGRATGHTQTPRLTHVNAAHIFKRNPVGNGSAPVIRREALQGIAYRPPFETERDWYFDETFRQSEDIECWLRIALSTDWEFGGVSGLLTSYRINAEGLSANTERQFAAWKRMVAKLRAIDPAFFARHEPAARAYQLRYLARRAVSDMNGPEAARLMQKSLSVSLRPLFEEPAKSLTTIAAALILSRSGSEGLSKAVRVLQTAKRLSPVKDTSA